MEFESKVILMRGIPGSGKSTIARQLAEAVPGARIVGADEFFVRLGGGTYLYDRARIREAHADCMRRFIDAMIEGVPLIIVDNTGTRARELHPYMSIAQAFDLETRVVHVKCDLAVAIARCNHPMSLEFMERMAQSLADSRLPEDWTVDIVRTDPDKTLVPDVGA